MLLHTPCGVHATRSRLLGGRRGFAHVGRHAAECDAPHDISLKVIDGELGHPRHTGKRPHGRAELLAVTAPGETSSVGARERLAKKVSGFMNYN